MKALAKGSFLARSLSLPALALAACPGSAWAQDAAAPLPAPDRPGDEQPISSADVVLKDIVVTARRRSESLSKVPLSVSAFGEQQLQTQQFRNLGSLNFSMPNVQLNDNGAQPGYANFSIRGLGLNSSIPSTDPTVGVFLDGIYQGLSAGLVFDNFDIEAIEVLRGPQGVLFGRNVPAGAILIRTKKPTEDLEVTGRLALESGLKVVGSGGVSGPIAGEKVLGKIAAYYSNDRGYFTNTFNGDDHFGKQKQFLVRPALEFKPSETVDLLLRYEYGKQTGDGAVGQNNALFNGKTHDVQVNEEGYINNHWNALTAELNVNTGFGDGTITNLFGWKKFYSDVLSDIDSTGQTQFHLYTLTEQEQFSNELRYAGTFGAFKVTTGLYYFTQDLKYFERRILAAGSVIRDGGGFGTSKSFGAFSSVDWKFADRWTLNAGLRYTKENKDATVATIRQGGGDYFARTLAPDFSDKKSFSQFTPRIGFQYEPSAITNVYGYYARGFRSGGYNFRNTIVGAPPGPYDAETEDTFELGLKQRFAGNRGRFTAAVFQNTINNIQRDVQVPLASAGGVAQLFVNAGKARIRGFEVESQFSLTKNLVLSANAGYLQDKYLNVIYDISGDGVVNGADYALKLPKLAPWTYGGSIIWDVPLSAGSKVTSRAAFAHRDRNFHTDNNLGIIPPSNTLDLSLAWTSAGNHVTVSVYANNVTNDVIVTGAGVLPDTPAFGGDGPAGPRPLPTISPLLKGRVIGGEVRFNF